MAVSAAPRRRSVAASTVLVMAASALSAVLGFGREIVSAHFYGTRAEMDAFLNASTIPVVLFAVFNGALISALVPTFSEYINTGRPEEARKLGSTVINALLFLIAAVAAFGWLLAPFIVHVIARGFPPAEQGLEVQMVRWLMPSIVATCISGVCTALLNANHRFVASALVQVAANFVTIAIVSALHRELGIFALVLGTLLGLFAQLLVQVPSILRHHLYEFRFDWRHPGIARIWASLIPVAVGSGALQINTGFDRYFASTLHAGSTAAIGYTTKLASLPYLIVAFSIGTVTFPLIAGQFASADLAGVRRSILVALQMVSFITIPSALGLSALAYPIVQTLFQRGAFGPSATALCASLIPFACAPLIALSYGTVLGKACYACKEIRIAVVGSVCSVAINIVLSATLLPILGARGLLLSNGVAGLLLVAFEIALLWRLIDGFEWRPLLSSILRVTFASCVMAGVLLWIEARDFAPAPEPAPRAIYLAFLLAIAALVYIGVARALRVEELAVAVNMITKKFPRASA